MDAESWIDRVVETLLGAESISTRGEAMEAVFAAWEEPFGFHFRTISPAGWTVRIVVALALSALFVFAGWTTGDFRDFAIASFVAAFNTLIAILFTFAWDLLHLQRSIAVTRYAILCFGHSMFTAHYWNRSALKRIDLVPAAAAENRFGCDIMVVHRKYASPRTIAIRGIAFESLMNAIRQLGIQDVLISSTGETKWLGDSSPTKPPAPNPPALDGPPETP